MRHANAAESTTVLRRLTRPRWETRNKLHKLGDIVMITLCAVLGGYEDWVSIEDFGYGNKAWLRGFLELPNGIPSHDTLSDVIGRIDHNAFAKAFSERVWAGLPELAGHQVSINDKSLRDSRGEDGTIHVISAFATQARLVLAAQSIPDKANEITAIPGLLAKLIRRTALNLLQQDASAAARCARSSIYPIGNRCFSER